MPEVCDTIIVAKYYVSGLWPVQKIYVKPSGVGSTGRFSFDNVVYLTYNILNKTASKGGQGSPSWRNIELCKPPTLPESGRLTYFSGSE